MTLRRNRLQREFENYDDNQGALDTMAKTIRLVTKHCFISMGVEEIFHTDSSINQIRYLLTPASRQFLRAIFDT